MAHPKIHCIAIYRYGCTRKIAEGHLLRILEHPNRGKYPGQRLLEVDVQGYVHLVPCVENDARLFLKTIFPGRKATKARRQKP